MLNKLSAVTISIALVLSTTLAFAGNFDLKEQVVSPSPQQPRSIQFPAAEKVIDFDISPAGPEAAILIRDAQSASKVVFWKIDKGTDTKSWNVPAGFVPRGIVWHPVIRRFFLSGLQGAQYIIMAVTEKDGAWVTKTVYKSVPEIRRVNVGPRPFQIGFDEKNEKNIISYRLFFAKKATDGNYSIRSVTEEGTREYQVVGPRSSITTSKEEEEPPSKLVALSALPIGFHPAGHILLYEDQNRCFNYAIYGRDHWEKSSKLFGGSICGGTITATPNGLGLIYWKPATDGVTIYYDGAKSQTTQAKGYTFTSTPSSVPDGKGIVGLTKTAEGSALNYVPIEFPLADVVNAWMYIEAPQDLKLLVNNAGLFRDLEMDQLYSLYDSESYIPGSYDESSPTRPYFVTSDIMWEVFAAAYEGIFIVKEKHQAAPAFWALVDAARQEIAQTMPGSKWNGVFTALAATRKPNGGGNAEAARILKAEGKSLSSVLGEAFTYGELKPRGHYTSEPEMELYFKAFKYLTTIKPDEKMLAELKGLPPQVKTKADAWIGTYENFISPPRAPLVWKDGPFTPPPYTKWPVKEARLFPLSWGFDNEVLLSTVYHRNWPPAEQIDGPSGRRLVPSGLDIAAATGSAFAMSLLGDELNKYPNLRAAIVSLNTRFNTSGKASPSSVNLYDRWMTALAVQWAEDIASPNRKIDEKIWRAKRLQTALSSWTVLRHATVLVNERTVAEAGEGGFEQIMMRPPRGYVEPDPNTFESIAGLFDAVAMNLRPDDPSLVGNIKTGEGEEPEPLRAAITKRLAESAQKARLFKSIAEKELRGEPLTDAEYEEILYVARIAEHQFLVYKSLANKDLALSNPDPMPKIVDVAGGGEVPFLLSGVGRPMEWDHIVPFFGRKQIVKGGIYSYYEFTSADLMNDKEWLQKLPSQAHPSWISPYISKIKLSQPAKAPY